MFEDDERKPDRGGQRPRNDEGDEGKSPRGVNFKNSRLLLLAIIAGIVLLVVAGTSMQMPGQTKELKDWIEFRKLVETGPAPQVANVKIDGRNVTGEFEPGHKLGKEGYTKFHVVGPDNWTDADKDWLYKAGRERGLSIEWQAPSPWPSVFWALAPWAILFFFVYFFIIRQLRAGGGPGGVLSFGKTRATLITKDKSKKTFKDVAGIDEAKEEVQEIVGFLKNPKKFQRLGGRIPKGVLLIGPPGTGKTLLAKAIAGEADVPFYSISGSDFVEMFVGVGASRVRDLFQQAKENSPCIIFLDEIDAVGRRRGTGLGGGHDEREQTLNEILVQMDGFESDEKIIVMAATNRPDVLDPALLRPGRFDRHVYVELPDVKGREQILKVHARKVKMAGDVDLSKVSKITPMFSGADLESLINEAALLAVMRDKDAVEMNDLEEARDKVKWGREKRSRVMDENDRWVTAFHEAGHALLMTLLPKVDRPHKVTIMPRGPALGATHSLPSKDVYNRTRQELLGQIKVLFGGRIAEQMFVGDVSTGDKGDIDNVTLLARKMVCEWGMSELLGPIRYEEDEETLFLGREVTRTHNISPETAVLIDKEVRRIVDECYAEAKAMLEQHRPDIELVAKALMEYEVLSGDEVAALVRDRRLPDDRKPLKLVTPRSLLKAPGETPAPGAQPLPGSALPTPQPA